MPSSNLHSSPRDLNLEADRPCGAGVEYRSLLAVQRLALIAAEAGVPVGLWQQACLGLSEVTPCLARAEALAGLTEARNFDAAPSALVARREAGTVGHIRARVSGETELDADSVAARRVQVCAPLVEADFAEPWLVSTVPGHQLRRSDARQSVFTFVVIGTLSAFGNKHLARSIAIAEQVDATVVVAQASPPSLYLVRTARAATAGLVTRWDHATSRDTLFVQSAVISGRTCTAKNVSASIRDNPRFAGCGVTRLVGYRVYTILRCWAGKTHDVRIQRETQLQIRALSEEPIARCIVGEQSAAQETLAACSSDRVVELV